MGVIMRRYAAASAKTLAIAVILSTSVLAAGASHRSEECTKIHNECVVLIDYGDGVFWLARRVVEDGQVSWVRIKRAACPTEQDYHYHEYDFVDSKYGGWTCKYDEVHERPTPASVKGKLGRYIGTHKVLLVTDAALVLTSLADAASTDHCLSIPGCKETNPLVGSHPSDLEVYGVKMGLTAGLILFDHKWVRDADHYPRAHAIYLWAIPFCVFSVADTFNNARVASNLPEARAHLMQQVPLP